MTDTKTEEASITEGIQALPIWPGILEVGPHRQKENTTSRMERHKVQRQETGKLTMATHPPGQELSLSAVWGPPHQPPSQNMEEVPERLLKPGENILSRPFMS